ncbi:DUF6492 family protein [Bosea sp. PAMC 26642]|uniref:DUF6492 family protein n=1 Tax=Bosea sp. (strain PAMC 26642) TaxID=1792307 RepID=UPI00076FF6D6|nr:DUF6492 family protein [Bosea sp. PAMC 26642]AMJ62343.1 hypothetical protein AXW83_20380 [Bosea sp. PAMC 26642]
MNLSYAIATPSYAGDLERCRLLCASIDRFVTGYRMHYILVEDRDLQAFRTMEGPRRRVIPESALLPSWLKAWPDPFTRGRRRVWTGLGALLRGVPPLRGWHAQQLRKLALPRLAEEDVILFADSDMLFLRPFDLASLADEGGVRLYVKPAAITSEMAEHAGWCRGAAELLGLPPPAFPSPDYINNLISWRRETALALLAHIEKLSGRDWVSAIAAKRGFSEYIIYGYFAERVLGLAAAGQRAESAELCKVYWGGSDADGIASLRSFEEVLEKGQVAVGVQSFIGQPVAQLRALFEAQ